MSANIPSTELERILIIGAGFGGITLARKLADMPYQVVLIDKNNYHTFQPLLYQVATGGLEPDSIAFPMRKLFSGKENVVIRVAEVTHVDPALQTVQTTVGPIEYDYLVIATGSTNNYFGNEAVAKNAFALKSVPEALNLRSMILQNFEKAVRTTDDLEKRRLMQFVIVGGGPTGVETAGALAELQRHVLPNDYPELDLSQMRVHLIEAVDRLLVGMSDKSGKEAKKALEKLGVNVWLNSMVANYDGEVVKTQDELELEAYTVLWAAGVKGNYPSGIPVESIGKGSRILVNRFNQVEGVKNIYAIGDIALMQSEEYPEGHPQVAPVAMQQAKHVAKNFKHKLKSPELTPFSYFDKGSMATIGRNKAVADFAQFHLKGWIAWMAWMFVHLMFLMGFRNKLVVFINWFWSYLTYDKGARLIIRPFKKEEVQTLASSQRKY